MLERVALTAVPSWGPIQPCPFGLTWPTHDSVGEENPGIHHRESHTPKPAITVSLRSRGLPGRRSRGGGCPPRGPGSLPALGDGWGGHPRG